MCSGSDLKLKDLGLDFFIYKMEILIEPIFRDLTGSGYLRLRSHGSNLPVKVVPHHLSVLSSTDASRRAGSGYLGSGSPETPGKPVLSCQSTCLRGGLGARAPSQECRKGNSL